MNSDWLQHGDNITILILQTPDLTMTLTIPVRKVSYMKKFWHENFMSENFIFKYGNEISLHENENSSQKCSCVRIPCMKLRTAYFSHDNF